MTHVQNLSGVFVCLLESCLLSLMPVSLDVRLVSVYYLILVLAAYLVSFDLLYALPCCVRQLSLIGQIKLTGIFRRIIISTMSTSVNRKLIQKQQTTC